MALERLQKVLAQAGIASRRKSEEIITGGRVRVNGKVVTELGTRVDPQKDRVEVDGKQITDEETVVLILNKPRGVVSTVSDPEGRETVADLVKHVKARLFPVGRLDYATSGVLLMTNDGELANALTHPRYGVEKTYLVKVHGSVTEHVLDQWRKGVKLDDGETTRPAKEVFKIEEADGYTWIQITIKEGKNRQIRRMSEATGLLVSKLKRVAFAGLTIEGIPIGKYRELTSREAYRLKRDFLNPAKKTAKNRGDGA